MARALFIGLGGSGVITVGHIKAKFLSEFGLNRRELAEKCRFLFIDSDSKDLEEVKRTHESLCGPSWIDNGEIISIGGINPFREYNTITSRPQRSPAEERLLEWADGRGALSLQNAPLQRGAGANRQQGRIALWAEWIAIENAVTLSIQSLSQVANQGGDGNDPLTVYLVSGTCGGTGSSMFLDVANLVHRAYRAAFAAVGGEPDLVGVLFMPHEYLQIYKRKNSSEETLRRYASNAEAFFEEMEALLEDRWNGGGGKAFDGLAVRPLIIGDAGVFSVFSWAFCMDTVTNLGGTMTQEQMYSSAARALYHWSAGRIGGSVSSQTVNTLKANYAHDRSAGGLVPAFAALGYRELRYPEEYMERYFEKRFLVEVLGGVVGQDLVRIWPASNEANAYMTKVWKDFIGVYLQAGSAQTQVPNLERDATVLAGQGLDLPLGPFNNPKGKADKAKIGNKDLLNQLHETASYLLRKKESQLDAAWKNGPWSLQELLRRIEDRLGAEVEQIILRWGLHAAQDVVERLDNLCQEAIATPQPDNDLQERIAKINQEIQRLDGEIQKHQMDCLTKGREASLRALSGAYLQKIQKGLEGWVLQRQVEILNALCQGRAGLLDLWKDRLEEMIRELQNRSTTAKASYTKLASAFLATEQDATTVFLPRVASFVQGGSWLPDHLFSLLYESRLVPQSIKAGAGKTPVRFGGSFGLASELEGLHKALVEMLCSTEATGAEGGYQQDATVFFFRRALPLRGSRPEWEVPRLAGELESIAGRYIALKGEVDTDIKNEREKALHDRFRGLDTQSQEEIKKKFSPANVHFFVPMSNHEAQIHCVYCGTDSAVGLATELGYTVNDNSMTWVGGDSSNVLVLLKSGFRYTLNVYPERADYKSAFENSRRLAHSASGPAFVPHIDARFTRDGVRNVIRLMAARALSYDEKLGLYALAILWRFMGTDPACRDLLGRILDLDPRYVGEEKRETAPLLIEAAPSGGDNHVYVCTQVEMVGGRSAFLRKHFSDYGGANNHHLAFERIKTSPYPWDVLWSFADLIRSKGDAGWAAVIGEKRDVLRAKLVATAASSPSLKPFYDELSNSLIKEVDTLLAELNRRAAQGAVSVAGPSPAVSAENDPTI
jgi:hypothetical protein